MRDAAGEPFWGADLVESDEEDGLVLPDRHERAFRLQGPSCQTTETLFSAILFFRISILVAPAAGAQSPAHPVAQDGDGEPVQVLLLGVSHFAGSEGDDFTFAIDDILGDHRQRELDEAARLLAEFGAHRSYLECLPEQEARVNEQYRRYLSGELDPTAEGLRNEIHQLGFRTDAHIGADLVGEWYKRNLRIFANIVHDVDTDTDRIFVMFGAGHVWTLRQFFEDHPGFDLVPVAEVLR